ncbi:phage tail tape measure protein [Kitasatospora sp. NPDC001175]|uniref:phage tail tape measure protein n=1 Tax=Kitasatospora sp. NPDC001175 TaxID=3157103 RepID=UPI003CFFE6BF
MADRTVLVRVTADTAGFDSRMRSSATAAGALERAAVGAGRGTRGLAAEAGGAQAGLSALGSSARGGAAGAREAEQAAGAAARGVRSLGSETQGASGLFGRLGSAARDGMTSVREGIEGALESATHLGTMLAGGALLYGLHDIIHAGNEYSDAMQKYGEVTRASGAQMAAAGREAQALGSDMKLPSANAAEAAEAMTELAKAGLSAEDAVKAARGTIQLSAAARTDVATAAKIEGDIMDQFAMKADDASKVADVLANATNSASGELMDMYYAMKYVGPTAHSLGISIEDTATAIGLLGKSGIIGETAGTSLRGALVNLAKPTAEAKKGLQELGIEAFDSQGNFKGLEYVIDRLHDAQGRLTQQQFTAAAAMAFGKPALSAMTALAHQGGPAFEQMALQVGRVGGAAALAAAESKGLGGAMRGLGKEISSAFLQIYLAISPSLEKITRSMSSGVSAAIPYIQRGIKTAADLWAIYGPSVEHTLQGAGAGIARAAGAMAGPVSTAVTGFATRAIPLLAASLGQAERIFQNAESATGPLLSGLRDLYTSVVSGAGALGTFTGRVQTGMSMLGDLSGELRPLAGIVGDLAHAFAELPGPIQLSVLGMIAMRPFRPQIQAMQDAVVGFGRSGVEAFRGIGDAALYQRVLAAGAGQELGRFGGYIAELERRSPVIANMGSAFRGVYETLPPTATGLERVGGALRGVGAAGAVGALAGLKSAASGLLGVFGGPWGLAVGGAFAILDIFAEHQRAARQAVADFTQAIQKDAGALGENSRALVAQKLEQAGALDTARRYGIELGVVEQAALGNKAALDQVNAALQAHATHQEVTTRAQYEAGTATTVLNSDARKLWDTLSGTSGEVAKASQAYRNQAEATRGAAGAAADATNPTGRLQAAIKTLGDSASDAGTRARALHDALQLLSGGELDVEAATAQMNRSMLDLSAAWQAGVDESKGYGAALLQVDGSLNTTTENGQTLWTKLQSLNEQTAAAAQATFDYAKANGDSVPTALAKAEKSMQGAWEAAVTAGEKFGLTADQAANLAAQMGFIPSSLAITLSTPGLDDTARGLLYVQGLAGHLPAGASIKVSALTADAVKDLESVGIKVKEMPGGRQMEITAPTGDAIKELDALIAKKIPGKTVVVDAPTQAAIAALEEIKAELGSVPAGKSITVQAPPAEAIRQLRDIGYTVDELPDHQVSITVPTGSPISNLNAIQDRVDNMRDGNVTVHVHYDMPAPGHMGEAFANGGITGYAAGGITAAADGLHNRQAGISNRAILWAEAGPEAYIPLSPSKRARSTQLLGQVATEFGYQLVPSTAGFMPARSLAPVGAAPAAASSAPGGRPLTIEHYYEAAGSSARSTAEELWWLSRTRG